MPDRILDALQGKMSKYMPNRIPEYQPEDMADRLPEYMSDIMPDRMYLLSYLLGLTQEKS